jgi:hypothetical protein
VLSQASYVRTDAQLNALRSIRQGGGAFSIILPKGQGGALHATAQDNKLFEQLVQRFAALQHTLHLAEPLHTSSAQYLQGTQVLRAQEISKVQRAVEAQVSGLLSLREQRRGAGESSNHTRNMDKQAERKRLALRKLLADLRAWEEFGLEQQQGGPMPETTVQSIFRGSYPWATSGQHPAAADLAAKYRDAAAELERCEEEVVLLEWEMQQTKRYYRYMEKQVERAIDDNESKMGEVEGQLQQWDADGRDQVEGALTWVEAGAAAMSVRHMAGRGMLLYTLQQKYKGLSTQVEGLFRTS